ANAEGQDTRMALEEEAEPRRPARLEPLVLDMMGVAELRFYIAALQAEIARVEAEIARKESHRTAADAFFRRP
ncbi:MAG: DUF1192 domain-containing protein, partial [Acetobacteraceae bacterium]